MQRALWSISYYTVLHYNNTGTILRYIHWSTSGHTQRNLLDSSEPRVLFQRPKLHNHTIFLTPLGGGVLGVIDKSQLTNRSVTLGTPPPPIFILIYLFSGAPSGHHFSFSSTGACSKLSFF